MAKYYSDMRGWVTLFVNSSQWKGEDGIWAKRASDGAWFVLRFTDLVEAGGEEFKDTPYECTVIRLDLEELQPDRLKSALSSSGYVYLEGVGGAPSEIRNDYDQEVVASGDDCVYVMLESAIMHGVGAQLENFEGKRYVQVRGQARKAAEILMRDAASLERKLDTPWNAAGTTAREAGAGFLVFRGSGAEHELLKKISPDTPVAARHSIRHIDMGKCPFSILLPEHYRSDGSCKCDDKVHRQVMVQQWGYKDSDFKDIPTRTFVPDLGDSGKLVHRLKSNGG